MQTHVAWKLVIPLELVAFATFSSSDLLLLVLLLAQLLSAPCSFSSISAFIFNHYLSIVASFSSYFRFFSFSPARSPSSISFPSPPAASSPSIIRIGASDCWRSVVDLPDFFPIPHEAILARRSGLATGLVPVGRFQTQ